MPCKWCISFILGMVKVASYAKIFRIDLLLSMHGMLQYHGRWPKLDFCFHGTRHSNDIGLAAKPASGALNVIL